MQIVWDKEKGKWIDLDADEEVCVLAGVLYTGFSM